jgi:hypothetical protein
MLYGALTKEMDLAGLLVPYPVAPFSGMSFEDLCSKIHNIRSPVWNDSAYNRSRQHTCNLKKRLAVFVDKATDEISGLELRVDNQA